MTEQDDNKRKDNKDVDEAVDETFPASDPPSWMAGKGTPGADDEDLHKKISKEEAEWLKARKKQEQEKNE